MEGNGRTQRLFIEALAKKSGYQLNLSKVSQDDMIHASIEGVTGNIKSFQDMFEERLFSEKHEPIKIKSKLDSSPEKNYDMHPSPSIDPFKKPWER
jgi:cell filamentation protein